MLMEINHLQPDIIWVGLGTPKQERFMSEYLPKMKATLMIGVGAAFDFHTGRIKDSPDWVKRMGLQWMHRLFQEPDCGGATYSTTLSSFSVRSCS